jgi:outer membrane protein assembly factor BamB
MRKRSLPFLFSLIACTLTLLTSCGGGLPAISWFGIAASDDTVYLAANEQVFALDVESGDELWAFPLKSDREIGPFYATPLLESEAVVVGGFGDGKLYALSQSDGGQNWAVETDASIVEGAVSTNGKVVVGNNEGEVYLIDAETQREQIILQANKPIWAVPLVDEVNGRIYIAAMDHRLYAVDLESGEQLWSFKAGGALAGTPALDDGVLYLGALDSKFYAIDAETGQELWRFKADGWVWGGPLVDEGPVYFGDMSGRLHALDVVSQEERWTFEAEGGVRVTPLLVDGLLYFGTRKGQVYAVNATNGTQEWTVEQPGAIHSQPVISGGYLLVAPHNAKAKLVALELKGLAERWSYPREE